MSYVLGFLRCLGLYGIFMLLCSIFVFEISFLSIAQYFIVALLGYLVVQVVSIVYMKYFSPYRSGEGQSFLELFFENILFDIGHPFIEITVNLKAMMFEGKNQSTNWWIGKLAFFLFYLFLILFIVAALVRIVR